MTLSKFFKLLTFFSFVVLLFSPRPAYAASTDMFTSPDSFFVKIQETVEYFFTFKVEDKVAVLERQADKRLTVAQDYAEEGNNERVQSLIQSYLQIKEKQNDLLEKTKDGNVLSSVEERTVEQQKTMEEIKIQMSEGTKQEVVQAQEQVVNQVAEKVMEVKGTEGKTEFFEKVEHVWAPGTGPGGEAGVVYEGGGKLIFAPGTSAGSGNAASDIKTVEIKTGGTVNDPVPVPDGSNYAPGTSGNSSGNTTNSGGETVNPVSDNPGPGIPGTWLAP